MTVSNTFLFKRLLFFSITSSLMVKKIPSMFTQFTVQDFNVEFLIKGWMSLFKFSVQVFSLSSSLVHWKQLKCGIHHINYNILH